MHLKLNNGELCIALNLLIGILQNISHIVHLNLFLNSLHADRIHYFLWIEEASIFHKVHFLYIFDTQLLLFIFYNPQMVVTDIQYYIEHIHIQMLTHIQLFHIDQQSFRRMDKHILWIKLIQECIDLHKVNIIDHIFDIFQLLSIIDIL